ncbi:MAG: hypothetical protein WDZ31_04665 [Phycisphaeraceae bacterium]
MSITIDIADAVVATLNAATFSQPVTAERAYLPRYELSEMQDLRVTVVPKEMTTTTASRGAASRDLTLDVAVQKKLGAPAGAQSEQDALMELSEEVADYLRTTALAGQAGAKWVRTEHTAIYAPEHLEQLRQFTSVVTLTYRVIK